MPLPALKHRRVIDEFYGSASSVLRRRESCYYESAHDESSEGSSDEDRGVSSGLPAAELRDNVYPIKAESNCDEESLYDYQRCGSQETQLADDLDDYDITAAERDSHLFGWLEPLDARRDRLDFERKLKEVKLGSDCSRSQVIIKHGRISREHCTFDWNGKTDSRSSVTLTDWSTNGTWINGIRLGKRIHKELNDGDIVGFATKLGRNEVFKKTTADAVDLRYIFHHTAAQMEVDVPQMDVDDSDDQTVVCSTHSGYGEREKEAEPARKREMPVNKAREARHNRHRRYYRK